jgi:hypothetical protein
MELSLADAPDNRRGQNLNHLLNFQYKTTEQERGQYRGRKKKMAVVKKEAIIQANCHFVLCPGEHAQSMFDPDHLVDWPSVEQVLFPTTEEIPSCPVCMDEPVAPKMTKCGHIFCFSCILHYLSLGEHSWSRCPLCFDSVYPKALKSVDFHVQNAAKVDTRAQFVLVTREKGSIGCVVESTEEDVLPESLFHRITTTADISRIVERELSQLRGALDHEEDPLEKRYFEIALEAVQERKKEWIATYGEAPPAAKETQMPSSKPASSAAPAQPTPMVEILSPQVKQEIGASTSSAEPDAKASFKMSASATSFNFNATASSFSPGVEVSSPKVAPAVTSAPANPVPRKARGSRVESRHVSTTSVTSDDDVTQRRDRTNSGRDEDSDKYIFFQSLDGACVYLHSFNFRCLMHEFGSEQSFPPRLDGKILYLDSFVQNDDTRGKFRFLAHLPLRTAFRIALVDLKHVLSAATTAAFAPELDDLRRRRNATKKRAELLEKKRLAANPTHSAEDDDPFGLRINFRAGFNAGFAMETEDGAAFPGLAPDSPSPEMLSGAQQQAQRQAPTGWNAVAEKGFYGAALHEPSMFELSGRAPPPVITGSAWGKIAATVATPPAPVVAPAPIQVLKGKKGKGKVLLLW